jgi:glutamate carboxypeptidase
MKALAPTDSRCTIEVTGGPDRGALERTPAAAAMYAVARGLAAGMGKELGEGSTGGASDGNIASAVGCPTLDGLGADGGGAHTLEERVLVADVPFRIALIAGLIAEAWPSRL